SNSLDDKYEDNLSLITCGDSPAVIDNIPSIMTSFTFTSRFDFSLNLFANGCHNTYPVKIPSNVAMKAADIAAPKTSIFSILPSAAMRPTTAPSTPSVGAYVPAWLNSCAP